MRIVKRTLGAALGVLGLNLLGLGLLGLAPSGLCAQDSLAQRMPPTPPASTVIFPLDEVRPGLHAVAYTVFEGVTPEPMEVEILGRLKNGLGPGRDMILARLHGPKPEYTGVVAGMSGSPVYVDGRLLGALSFRIGQFSKEPIAGITPIGQMLEVQRGAAAVGSGSFPAVSGLPEIQPMEEPLVFGGFGPGTIARFGDGFRKLGLDPVAGLGSMDTSQRQAAPLEPGSAVSAVLVDGDLSITGTCTVSYLDAGRVMACGHPITQAGGISLPMAKAEVLATLPSASNSFKIVNATEIVGAFTEDRSSAIYGRLGAQARMIPVRIALKSDDPAYTKEFHLNVANHRELTPQLMLVSLFQTLQQVETAGADASYHVQGEIRLARQPEDPGPALPAVELNDWAAPTELTPGAVAAAIRVGTEFAALYSNALEQPTMTGVDLQVEVTQQRRSVELESARLLTPEVSPGSEIEVEAVVRPFQRPAEVLREKLRLPATLGPGPVRLLVSDGATLDRLLAAPSQHVAGLEDTVHRLNSKHRNNRVYVALLDRSAQAVLDAAALPEVPLSLANVLNTLKDSQRLRLNGESVLELGSKEMAGAVSGSQVLQLTVR